MTIGIDAVDLLAAKVAAGLIATITSTLRRTSSAASREVTEPLRLPFWIAPLDGKVQPFEVPHFAQGLPQEIRGTEPEDTDSEYLPRRLRLSGERRGEEAARQTAKKKCA